MTSHLSLLCEAFPASRGPSLPMTQTRLKVGPSGPIPQRCLPWSGVQPPATQEFATAFFPKPPQIEKSNFADSVDSHQTLLMVSFFVLYLLYSLSYLVLFYSFYTPIESSRQYKSQEQLLSIFQVNDYR